MALARSASLPAPGGGRAATGRVRRAASHLAANRKLAVGGAMTAALVLVALFAPLLAPYAPDQMGAAPLYARPGPGHWFGADEFGRDLFSRILYGTRLSLGVAFIVTAISASLGCALGLAAGFLGGRTDSIIGSLTDLLFGVPTVLLALFTATIIGPGLQTVLIALSIVYVPQFARVLRGAAISVSGLEYVTAARALGASQSRIAIRHVLPNCLSPMIVQISVVMSLVILDEAALSFIGVGTQPPTPSWGLIIRQGLDYISRSAYPAVIAGAAISIAVLAFNLLADGLRDYLDPRLRGR